MKRKRSPIKWPDGARIAITPCVAFETWPEDLGAPGSLQQENRRVHPKNAVTKKSLASLTDREFGERVGVFRMMEIFHKEGIRTTFFPTGITIRNYPDVIKEAVAQGHEIGTETWIHDYSYMKKRDKEKSDLQKTVNAVKEVVGKTTRRISFDGSGSERGYGGDYQRAWLHLLDGPAARGNALYA